MTFSTSDSDGLELPKSSKRAIRDTPQARDGLHELTSIAAKNHASVIRLSGSDDVSVAEIESAVGETLRTEIACPIGPLLTTLNQRTFFWPDLNDPSWHTQSNRKRRMLTLSGSTPAFHAQILAQGTIGKSPDRAIISDITWPNSHTISNQFVLQPINENLITSTCERKTGIILTNESDEWHVSGTAIAMALRPDALRVTATAAFSSLSDLLDAATKDLLVIEMSGQDPVTLLSNFVAPFSAKEMGARAAGLLNGCIVHVRLPRVCAGCARTSPADASTLNFFPDVLRPRKDRLFTVGLGCDACASSGFKGSIGTDSVVFADERIRNSLAIAAPIDQLTELCYRAGTTTLVEDALIKAQNGQTTLSSITAKLKRPSAAFEASITSAQSESGETLGDKEIDSTLASLGDDFFISEGGSAKATVSDASDVLRAGRDKPLILIIEDDEDQQKILDIVLRDQGYDVTFADDGVDGIAAAKSQQPDLIISDLMMPKMNGNEVVSAVRAEPSIAKTPILILTVIDNPDAEHKLLESGADDYCPKTTRRDILLQRVARLLAR